MGLPTIENNIGFALEPLYLTDEQARPMLVVVIKATLQVINGSRVILADEQIPVNVAGEYWGEPGESSWKYEPEIAFIKPSADIILVGSAFAPHRGATVVDVRLRVGRVSKQVRVFGDRYWQRTLGFVTMSAPEPFETLPLIYERAFGGSEVAPGNSAKSSRYAANPVGRGFVSTNADPAGLMRLPNLEDPGNLISNFSARPHPAGFGYVSPDWQPRASLVGTYDERWLEERMPLLPLDFDRRFFNSASKGLVYPGFLRGDEPVLIENVSAGGTLSFTLPGLQPPACLVELSGGKKAKLETQLDTLILNTDESMVFFIWRGHVALEKGPFDVCSIRAVATHAENQLRHVYA